MSALASPGSLESGLRTLRCSKLMSQEEFRDLYGAIERHHRDVKLAHLTGKAKDLMEKDEKDTRFYNILLTMLCEVRQQQKERQKDVLKKVHSWYQANKHTLYSTPRFGKDQQKLEAREVLKAISRPKTPTAVVPHSKSASMTAQVNGDVFSAVEFMEEDIQSRHHLNDRSMYDQDTSTIVNVTDASHLLTDQESFADGPEKELQNLNVSLDDTESRATISVKKKNLNDDNRLSSLQYIESKLSGDRDKIADEKIDLPTNMEQSGRRRKLSRSQTATKSIRKALKEQSPNIPIGLSKRMVHSISSLVNPHAQLTALEVQVAEEEQASQDVLDTKIILSKPGQQVQFKNGKIPVMRPVTVAGTRADNLLRWKGFAKGMSYGQDILGKLDFVGRSGTALDIRYTAHGLGEMPEHLTNHALAQYIHGAEMESNVDDNVQDIQNTMMKQSLEDFYRTTDGKYSAKFPKYRPPSLRRTKTPHNEKMEKEQRSNTVMTPQINPLGKQILQHFEQEFKEPVQWLETRGQDISLDTVVNMIDTVTEDMNHFREKLAPTPQPGFRRPASSGVSTKPLSRPTTSQSQRSSSLVQKSNTPILEQTRSPSIQLSSRDIMLLSQDEADSYTCNSPLPGSNEVSPLPGSNEVQVVDWRGKSAPDTARYKWEKTKSGGHTYVKKLMNATSAGTCRAGKRPTTAPVSARERWNITDKPSDQNVRLAQAATNTMMLVDQKSVDSMMVIQHILGSSDSRMGSLGSLFLEFEYLRPSQLRQRLLPPTNATPEYEYVTDMCTSAPLSAAASRAQSRLSRYSERTESRVDFVPSHLPEKEVSIPIATDEQLPLMNDEETTQTDQVAPAEITYHIPLVEKPQTKYSDISLSRASSTDHFEISDSDLTGEEDVACQRARQGSQVGEKVTVTEKTSENFKDNGEIVSNSEKQVKERTESNFKLVSPQKEENVLIRITPISSKEKEGSKPQSDVWQYSSDGEIEKDLDQFKKIKSILANQSESALYHHGKSTVKSDTYCSNWSSQSNSAKVEKLAGRMPRGADSVPGQVIKMTKKQSEFFQNVPPLRMPASIPSPHHPLGGRSPRQGHVYSAELEQQARKMNSPRNFMNKINELRKDRSRSAPPVSPRLDISLASTLQVCHLPIPGRSRRAPMFQLGDEEHYPHTQQGLEPMTEGVSEHREEHVTSPTRVAFKSLDENDSHKSRAYIDHPIAQICQLPGPVADVLATYLVRHRFAEPTSEFQRSFPAC